MYTTARALLHLSAAPRVASLHARRALTIVLCTGLLVLHAHSAFAALTIAKNTWNVIGLDGNNVSSGPNTFPVAAVVCNTGPTDATNLTTTFIWDSANGLINLNGPSTINRGTLAAGACLRAYYWAVITRSTAAYLTTRRYHIAASADGGLFAVTPVRELYVEKFISQNRNTSQTPSGPTTVVVGQVYTYNWVGATATQGYEQIENFIAFNDSIFRVLSVQSTYTAGPSPIAGMYNDACGWNDDPASAGYRTCTGTNKAGGNVTMSVTVQIIGTGTTTLTGAIYDFSGSSYHYNSDFGTHALPVTAIAGGADVSVTKNDGVSSVNAGGTTTYSVVVRNLGPAAADGTIVRDPAVAGLTKIAVTCSAAGGAICPANVTVAGLESGLVIPTLPSGGSVTFTVTALVTATSGSVSNTATVTPPAGVTDSNPSNNTATDTDAVAAAALQTDLSVTKTDGVSELSPGASPIYTIVVTNNGPSAVTNATVTDAAPAGLTFGGWTCTGTGGGVCPASGAGNINVSVTLPVGANVTFRVNATVAGDAGPSITNTAAVTLPAGIADTNPANNTAADTDAILVQRIGVAKSAGTPQQVGPTAFEIPYTIVVSNIGSIPATNVQVTDSLDQTFVSGSPTLLLVGAPVASGIGGATTAECAVNTAFTGTGDATSLLTGNTTLAPGQGCSIAFRVRVTYPYAGSIPTAAQLNVAVATTYQSPGVGPIARDVSDSGTDPIGTNPGAPGDSGGSDDPTPVFLSLRFESPGAPVLSITKAVSSAVVELGDTVTYSIRVRNGATAPLPATSVEDHLPLGFSYILSTARLTVGSTTMPLPDPLGATTRVLVFAIPAQTEAREVTLTYQVRVSAGSQQGDGTNRAQAIAADGTRSNEARARVLVTSGVFTQQACIIGKVFVDFGGNALQDAREPGVPGVALYLEDGTSVVTDGNGSFSYCGLRAGTHVLKVDPATLPPGATLARDSNRNAMDPGSAFLDLKFGELHRADFVLTMKDKGPLADIERRSVASDLGTLNPESTPPVAGMPPADVSLGPTPYPPAPPAPQHPLLAVGLVEGIVSAKSFDRLANASDHPGDVFDEELRRFSRSFNDGQNTVAARAAMFLEGPIKGDYQLSLSFDSERPNHGALFRDIQPDAFYPIYGDASQKRFDAQSSQRAYAKLQRGQSYLMYGDFVTMPADSPARDLGTYARTLTGIQHRFTTKNVLVNVFATRDTQRQVVDEFAGRGISGPYSVSNSNGVSGTERVEIVTRDRNQPAIVLSTQPLTRFLDYEFEPFTGRVLFRRPVPSMDEQLNPVSIRVTYEIDGGGEQHWLDGIDGRVRLSPHVEFGGSFAQDTNDAAPYDLGSANATLSFGHTTVIGEVARSATTVNTNLFNQVFAPNLVDATGEASGNAARVELTHTAGRLRARAFAGVSDPTFFNPSATLNGGRTEAVARASYQLGRTAQLKGEFIRSSDRLTGGDRQGGLVAVESKIKLVDLEIGLRHVSETAEPAQGSSIGLLQPFDTTALTGFGFHPIGTELDPVTGRPVPRSPASAQLTAGRSAPAIEPIETTLVRARVAASFGKPWNAYAEAEQDVADRDKHMAAAGGEYRAADRARLYVRHEFISSLDGIYALREGQQSQRTVFGASSSYMQAGELFSEYRVNDAISGREAHAAIGLRNVWTIRDGLRLSTGLERLNPMGTAAATPATAATLGADYTKRSDLKASSRLEWRRDGAGDSWLSTAGLARRLSRDWTMLAKNYYQTITVPGMPNQVQDRLWAGTAYRDTDRNRRNLLSRYEFKTEYLPQPDTNGAIGDRYVHVVSTHGDYRRSQPWMLSGQYAGKWVHEQLERGPDRYSAHLISGRTGYDLTRRVDIGGLASVLWSASDDRIRKALGAEVGLLVKANTWLSLGYNVTGFSDRDFNDVLSTDSTTRGVFVRLRVKFDEDLFRH